MDPVPTLASTIETAGPVANYRPPTVTDRVKWFALTTAGSLSCWPWDCSVRAGERCSTSPQGIWTSLGGIRGALRRTADRAVDRQRDGSWTGRAVGRGPAVLSIAHARVRAAGEVRDPVELRSAPPGWAIPSGVRALCRERAEQCPIEQVESAE